MQRWKLSILKRAAMQHAHPIRHPHAVFPKAKAPRGAFVLSNVLRAQAGKKPSTDR
jgi:hypothetical protein